MSKEEKRAPEVRFEGFNDDWKQRKLGELAESFEYGLNVSATDYDDKNKYVRITDIDDTTHQLLQNNLTSPNMNLKSADKYLLRKGDIVFARTGASVGKTYCYNEEDGKVYYAGFLIRSRIKKDQIAEFIFQNTLTDHYNNFVRITSQRSGQPGINVQEYSKFTIMIPSKPEQRKISCFLKKIDNTIVLHQRKLEQLREFKRAALQYLFPKKDEAEPKVRFANFSSSWKQRKLGELGKLTSGIGFPNSEQGGNHGVPFFKISDMNNNGNEQEMITANNYVAHEQVYRNNWQPINEVPAIIFAKVGAAISLNRKRLVRYPFLIDNNTMAYSFDDNWSIEFGKAIFETIYLPKYAQIGALPSYNNSDIASVTIHIPDNKEQIHIGHLFNQIEHAIACHQKKLEKLQTLKKAFLQKMFI
ncbi:MAG: restriction endonuclease subunit S [Tetragenococcus koreensis]|nr:restriction endonuclease subunit S [Tetragenococcus koreensis]